MAVTDFKYSDVAFFRQVCPDFTKYLSRVHLKNFILDSSNRWKMGSIGSKPSMVYFDGIEGTEIIQDSGGISSFASGTNTTVNTGSAPHGMSNGESVNITESNNYNGTNLTISNVTSTSFDIATSYSVNDGTAKWELSSTSAIARVNASREFYYNESDDILYINVATSSNDPNDDEHIESGEDSKTFVEKQLTNASMMLNGLITSVVTPIPKSFIYNDVENLETPEYDYILKKAECLLAWSSMANAESDFELADRLYAQVTNFEGTGIVDKINDGSIQLSPFREPVDSRGQIIVKVGNAGTMILTETSGEFSGKKYERFKVVISKTGGIGVAEYKVYSSSSEKLYGNESSSRVISGTFDPIGGGLYARFEGNTAVQDDTFFIVVRNDAPSNANMGSVGLWR